jgi:hypothetical protein
MAGSRRLIAIPPEGFIILPPSADGADRYISSDIERSHFSSNVLISSLQRDLLNTFNKTRDKKEPINKKITDVFRSLYISEKYCDFLEYSILHAAGCFPLTDDMINAIKLNFDYKNPKALAISIKISDGFNNENLQNQLKMLVDKAKKIKTLEIAEHKEQYTLSLSYELAMGHFITNPILISRFLIDNKERLKSDPHFKQACKELMNDLKQFKGTLRNEDFNTLLETLNTYSMPSITKNSIFRAAMITTAIVVAAGSAIALNRLVS